MKNSARERRSAFTLIELLVVIAIIGLLIALLLPALAAVRETSRRSTCSNNIRQIALGFKNFNTAYHFFPDGGRNACDTPGIRDQDAKNCASPPSKDWGCCGPGSRKDWGWTYQIMPFIGEGAVHRHTSDSTIQKYAVSVYYCPTRRAPELVNGVGKVDYAGCAGSNGKDGMLVHMRAMTEMTESKVKDGLAHTAMLGEKQLNPKAYGSSYDDNEACVSTGWDSEIYREGSLTITPAPDHAHACFVTPCPDPDTASSKFGAAHTQVFNMAMGDASVHTFGYTINPEMFRRLCIINDGLQVSLEDLQ